jgi:hypothetical protein
LIEINEYCHNAKKIPFSARNCTAVVQPNAQSELPQLLTQPVLFNVILSKKKAWYIRLEYEPWQKPYNCYDENETQN